MTFCEQTAGSNSSLIPIASSIPATSVVSSINKELQHSQNVFTQTSILQRFHNMVLFFFYF